jgi:hypothetical protein
MIDKRLVGPAHKRSLNKFLLKVKQSGGTYIPPLSDDVMEQHGLRIDVDGSGNEVRRESTVSGEFSSEPSASLTTHSVDSVKISRTKFWQRKTAN